MSKKKNRGHFQSMRLKDNHSWKAPKGYKIVVIDRGTVSFNVPDFWIVASVEPFELHDGEPPDDDARISVSFWRLRPDVDWSDLSLAPMLLHSTEGIHDDAIIERKPIQRTARQDIELIWTEYRFIDPQEKREAHSRMALARGFNVQALITFDFWADDLAKSKPVWEEILRSLQLGRHIEDPTRGEILQ